MFTSVFPLSCCLPRSRSNSPINFPRYRQDIPRDVEQPIILNPIVRPRLPNVFHRRRILNPISVSRRRDPIQTHPFTIPQPLPVEPPIEPYIPFELSYLRPIPRPYPHRISQPHLHIISQQHLHHIPRRYPSLHNPPITQRVRIPRPLTPPRLDGYPIIQNIHIPSSSPPHPNNYPVILNTLIPQTPSPPCPLHGPVILNPQVHEMALPRLRTWEHEKTMIDIIARLMGVDHLSPNNDVRRAGLDLGRLRARNGQTLADIVKSDDMRRIKVTTQIANNFVTPTMMHAELHPKPCNDGLFPRDFELPRQVKDFLLMDLPTLDRILRSYNLPTADPYPYISKRPFAFLHGNLTGFPHRAREAKLWILFEHLGVDLDHRFRACAQASAPDPATAAAAAANALDARRLAIAGNAAANNRSPVRGRAGAGANHRNASPSPARRGGRARSSDSDSERRRELGRRRAHSESRERERQARRGRRRGRDGADEGRADRERGRRETEERDRRRRSRERRRAAGNEGPFGLLT